MESFEAKPQGIKIEDLLTHQAFLRGIAKGLLFDDEGRVDDAVQETWIVASKSQPRNEAATRSWLGTIVQRNAIKIFRRENRRRRREEIYARPEASSMEFDLFEKEVVRRQLMDAVFTLEEPYKSAIVLRYYEALPPRKIAARLQLPVETVRTHLKRGLQQLREMLDAKCVGSRRVWALALMPLARHTEPAIVAGLLGSVAGLSIVAKVFVGAACVLGAVGIIWGVSRTDGLATPQALVPANRAALETGKTASEPPQSPVSAVARTIFTPSGTPIMPVLRGEVMTSEGEVVLDATVLLILKDQEEVLWKRSLPCDRQGRFETTLEVAGLESISRTLTLSGSATAPNHRANMRRAYFLTKQIRLGEPLPELAFILEPGHSLLGRVVNAAGFPIPDARVGVRGEIMSFNGSSDGFGLYDLSLPSAGSVSLVAHHSEAGAGALDALVPQGRSDLHAPDIVIEPTVSISGVLVAPNNMPIPNMRIFVEPQSRDDYFWQDSLRTDESGFFQIGGLTRGNDYHFIFGFGFDRSQAPTYQAPNEAVKLVHPGSLLRLRMIGKDGAVLDGHARIAWWSNPDPALRSRILNTAIVSDADSDLGSTSSSIDGVIDHSFHTDTLVRIVALVDGYSPTVRVVELGANDYVKAIDIPMDAIPEAMCPLQMFVTGVDDAKIADYQLTIRSIENGEPLESFDERPPAEGEILLPPGKFLVQINSGWRSFADSMYLPYEREITMEKGKRAEFRQKLKQGSRLRLVLRLPQEIELHRVQDTEVYLSPSFEPRPSISDPLTYVFPNKKEMTREIRGDTPFLVGDLRKPGSYKLLIEGSALQAEERTILLEEGKTHDVEIFLQVK